MADSLSYRELDVWQQTRELVRVVYLLSSKFPREEQFGLTNQLRRSAISIPSNIAEGCGRNSPKDSLQFFFIARGSLYETETQLFLASDLEFIDDDSFQKVIERIIRCKKLVNGFINYFQRMTNNEQPTTINEIITEYGNSNSN